MKRFNIVIVKQAEKDIDAIYHFIFHSDGAEQANRIEERLMKAVLSLEKAPGRGKCPQEMNLLEINDFKELQVSPWRIFYYIEQETVFVVAVLDGRRNIGELLQKRLLQ